MARKNSIVVSSEIKITNDDVVAIAVNRIEQGLAARQKELEAALEANKARNKLTNKEWDDVVKELEKQFQNGDAVRAAAALNKAFGNETKDGQLVYVVQVHHRYGDDGKLDDTIDVTEQLSVHRLYSSLLQKTTTHPTPKVLKVLWEKLDEEAKENETLTASLVQIRRELANVPKFERAARAKLAEDRLRASGVDGEELLASLLESAGGQLRALGLPAPSA